MKSKIVVLLIVCLVYLSVLKPVSVNATDMITMKLDDTNYTGTTQKSVTYKLATQESSLVKIRIVYASTSPMTATLTNTSTKVQKIMESSIDNQKSTIEFAYYAEKFNYELTLDFTNGDNKTRYSLHGIATPKEGGDSTSGNTIDYAKQISIPCQINGIMGFGDNADYYKISLSSEQTLKFKIKNSGEESINLKLYDTYKDLFRIETIGSSIIPSEIELPNANGNYYVAVDRVCTNGFGTNYKLTIGDFVELQELMFSSKTLTLKAGSSKTMKAIASPSNVTEKFFYKSSNKSIATVDSNGKIIAKKAGKVTITAYNSQSKVKTSLKLTVIGKTITKVTLNTANKTMQVGKTFQLKPVAYPKGLKTTYKYTSSDSTIAKVDKNGKITAIKQGNCIITVKTKNGKATTCKVTVTK